MATLPRSPLHVALGPPSSVHGVDVVLAPATPGSGRRSFGSRRCVAAMGPPKKARVGVAASGSSEALLPAPTVNDVSARLLREIDAAAVSITPHEGPSTSPPPCPVHPDRDRRVLHATRRPSRRQWPRAVSSIATSIGVGSTRSSSRWRGCRSGRGRDTGQQQPVWQAA